MYLTEKGYQLLLERLDALTADCTAALRKPTKDAIALEVVRIGNNVAVMKDVLNNETYPDGPTDPVVA